MQRASAHASAPRPEPMRTSRLLLGHDLTAGSVLGSDPVLSHDGRQFHLAASLHWYVRACMTDVPPIAAWAVVGVEPGWRGQARVRGDGRRLRRTTTTTMATSDGSLRTRASSGSLVGDRTTP